MNYNIWGDIMDSSDIIANHVRDFWNDNYACGVVVFFKQKYVYEKEWDDCYVIASPASSDDDQTVVFDTDFCEGQTDVKDVNIVSLDEIIDFYKKKQGGKTQ